MTRSEHFAWAKQRALEYVDAGDLRSAVASMGSDLQKHDGFNAGMIEFAMTDAMLFQIKRGPDAVRAWINGFN